MALEKYLRDLRGEQVGRLVPVQPGRDRQAARRAQVTGRRHLVGGLDRRVGGTGLANAARTSSAAAGERVVVVEVGRHRQPVDRVGEDVQRAVGEERAQVGRLHHARAAAGHDQAVGAGPAATPARRRRGSRPRRAARRARP